MADDTIKPNEMSIDAYIKLFFTNFQIESRDQIKNMAVACRNFCRCFKQSETDIGIIDEMQENPVGYIQKVRPKFFDHRQFIRLKRVKLKVGRIEYIYFRDAKKIKKLRHPYYMDEDKPKIRAYFTLGEVIDIRDFIKDEITRIFTEVANRNSVAINPFLMQFSKEDDQPELIGV